MVWSGKDAEELTILLATMNIIVFEATDHEDCIALNKWLDNSRIKIIQVLSSAASSRGNGFRNYITILYEVLPFVESKEKGNDDKTEISDEEHNNSKAD